MTERDTIAMDEKKENASAIVEGWILTAKEYKAGDMSEQDKALFSRAIFAQEQGKKTSFVLGGTIRY